jgi:DNA (cytosine-5)-methyltransferase 1
MCLTSHPGRYDAESQTLIADTLTVGANQTTGFIGETVTHTLRASGFDASEDGTGRGTPLVPCLTSNGDAHSGFRDEHGLVPVSFPWQLGGTMQMPHDVDLCGTLVKNQTQAVAFDLAQITSATNRTRCEPGLPSSTLAKGSSMHVATSAVRRLTPKECERLQGFPDDWTLVPYRNKPAADGPRYKALGNSMAVPVMRWIGERIAKVDQLPHPDPRASSDWADAAAGRGGISARHRLPDHTCGARAPTLALFGEG